MMLMFFQVIIYSHGHLSMGVITLSHRPCDITPGSLLDSIAAEIEVQLLLFPANRFSR